MRASVLTIVWRCSLLLPLLFSFQLAPVVAAETSPDLAALVVRPSDLEAIGFPEVGISRSILADRPRRAAEFLGDFYSQFNTKPPVGAAIREANPDLTYVQFLHARTSLVIVTLMAFAGDRDAERGMDAYVGEIENWLRHDASELTLGRNVPAAAFEFDPGGGKDAFEIIVFRSDSIVVVVQGSNLEEADAGQLQDIAELQLDRVAAFEQTGISDFVTRLMRLRIDGWNTEMSTYYSIDGEAIRTWSEISSPGGFESRQESYTSQGFFNVYRSIQTVYGDMDSWSGADPSGPIAYVSIDIIEHESEADVLTPEEVRNLNSQYPEIDVPIEGYQTYGLIVRADEGYVEDRYTVWVWLDETTVMTFRHVLYEGGARTDGVEFEFDIESTNDLILHQLGCFEGTRSCDTAIRSPYTYDEES